MSKKKYTHQVAVNGYVIQNNKFLLLKRNNPPFIWGPPGGRLKIDEDPLRGLRREVKEETNLNINIIAIAGTWFGEWGGESLLSLDFLTAVTDGELKLSKEHSAAVWFTINELKQKNLLSRDSKVGFTLKDFTEAWQLYKLITDKKPN
jgi:ADP-ribose pyrophosphatase YjhB (NUDIX family)